MSQQHYLQPQTEQLMHIDHVVFEALSSVYVVIPVLDKLIVAQLVGLFVVLVLYSMIVLMRLFDIQVVVKLMMRILAMEDRGIYRELDEYVNNGVIFLATGQSSFIFFISLKNCFIILCSSSSCSTIASLIILHAFFFKFLF